MEVQDSKIYFFPFPAELPERSKICWWSHSIILICGDLDLDLKVSEKIFSSDLRSTLPTEGAVESKCDCQEESSKAKEPEHVALPEACHTHGKPRGNE
ncbi:uncharacterized protein [Macaca nemestrina]|uniref:uncharacterized protein isoform X9 n=1 Tax=Macaca nemestrina TaxID=9545 RepID=UPI0039B95AD8